MLLVYNIFCLLLLTSIAAGTGNKTYNIDKHICCNGTLHERPNTTEYQIYCCGKDLQIFPTSFDNSVFILPKCCNGKLYEKPQNKFECCGAVLYNSSSNLCIGTEIVPIPPGFQNTSDVAVCVGKNKDLIVYNYFEKFCCSGVVHDRKNGLQCCKNVVYNSSTSSCCGETVIPVPKEKWNGRTCCGNALYNDSEAICCYINIEHGNDWNNITSINVPVALDGKERYKTGCCRNKLFDYYTQACCGDGVVLDKPGPNLEYYGCCGTEFITDYNNQFCVDNKIVWKNNPNEKVCGNKVYDEEKHFCYNYGTLVERKKNETMCAKNGLTYVRYEQACAQNFILTLTDDDKGNGRFHFCEELPYGQFDLDEMHYF